jgi:hypothetical protein
MEAVEQKRSQLTGYLHLLGDTGVAFVATELRKVRDTRTADPTGTSAST